MEDRSRPFAAAFRPPIDAHSEHAVVWQRCIFSEDADNLFMEQWSRWVIDQVESRRGHLLCWLGTSLVLYWNAVDCLEVAELCLSLLEKAEREHIGLQLGSGIALGHIRPAASNSHQGHAFMGASLDRAQLLSTRARGHEIIVDEKAHERLSERYLFGRESGSGAMRGYSLDLVQPRKLACRKAVGALHRAPVPKARLAAYNAVSERLSGKLQHNILFRCDTPFEPLDWLERLSHEDQPGLRLHFRSQAGGLQPLGSLQAALAHPPQNSGVQEVVAALGDEDRGVVQAVIAGEAVHRARAAQLVQSMLSQPVHTPWIILHRLHDVDAASLGVLAECTQQLARKPLLFACVPLDGDLPEVLFPQSDRYEVKLGDLPLPERQATAAATLGVQPQSPIARRVALLSDPTPLGILEACRTLVAAGDLVQGPQGFRWRVGPRSGQESMPIDALIAERVAGAPALAYRMLEVLSIAGASAAPEHVIQLAERDGISAEQAEQGLQLLMEEAFIDSNLSFGAFEHAIRLAVRSAMPPARLAELHRFASETLVGNAEGEHGLQGFGRALLSYHLAEGGLLEQAAETLLDAAEAALNSGFQRMAVRLAANARQLDNAPALRERALRMMHKVETPGADGRRRARHRPDHLSPVPEPDDDFSSGTVLAKRSMRAAVWAVRSQDVETVERHLDTAVAAGFGRGAAQRIHAMALLSRHDIDGAMLTLQGHAGDAGSHPGERARDALAWALVTLESGDAQRAVRSTLTALSLSREQGDSRGVQAALLVLSACYGAMGNRDAAARLAAGADGAKS